MPTAIKSEPDAFRPSLITSVAMNLGQVVGDHAALWVGGLFLVSIGVAIWWMFIHDPQD